jgi:hypothetical protein
MMVSVRLFLFLITFSRWHIVDPIEASNLAKTPFAAPTETASDIQSVSDCRIKGEHQGCQKAPIGHVSELQHAGINGISACQLGPENVLNPPGAPPRSS